MLPSPWPSAEYHRMISLCTTGKGSLNGFEKKYTIVENIEIIKPVNEAISFLFLIARRKNEAAIAQKYSFSDSIHSGIAKWLLSTGIIGFRYEGYSIKTLLYI